MRLRCHWRSEYIPELKWWSDQLVWCPTMWKGLKTQAINIIFSIQASNMKPGKRLNQSEPIIINENKRFQDESTQQQIHLILKIAASSLTNPWVLIRAACIPSFQTKPQSNWSSVPIHPLIKHNIDMTQHPVEDWVFLVSLFLDLAKKYKCNSLTLPFFSTAGALVVVTV